MPSGAGAASVPSDPSAPVRPSVPSGKSALLTALPPAPNRFLMIARMVLHTILVRISEAIVPAPLAMLLRIGGFWETELLHVAARLEIADRIATGGKTAVELAAEIGADADALHRTLRALAALGVFRMDGEGRVHNNRLSETLRKGGVASMHDPAEYFGSPASMQAWADLEATVRTGTPAFSRVHGASLWDWLARHPSEARAFAGTMTSLTEQDAPSIASSYDFGRHARICDVAGGRGTLLAEVLTQHRKPRGVLFDAAHVLEIATPYLEGRGVGARVERVAGSFFERVPEGCDAYVLKDILHDWDDARCRTILDRVRSAMTRESVLLVCEILVERTSTRLPGPLIDAQIMGLCEGGRQRSEAEHAALLGHSGLRLVRVHATQMPIAILEARLA